MNNPEKSESIRDVEDQLTFIVINNYALLNEI